MKRYEDLFQEIKEEFPKFKIVKKQDSILMKVINFLLILFSFGKNKSFMTQYTTTINYIVYVSTDWDQTNDKLKCVTLRHERVHMQQTKKYGFVLFSILYLFVYFPFRYCYYRTKFEQEAYEESIRAMYQYYGWGIVNSRSYKNYIIEQFSSSAYGWMMPNKEKVESWYDLTLKKILNEIK